MKTPPIEDTYGIWRRSLYDPAGGNVGGRNLEYADHSPDVNLFMRFSKQSPRWLRLDRFLSTSRHHPAQTSTRREKELCDECNRLALRQHYPWWADHPRLKKLLNRLLFLRRCVLLLIQGDASFVRSKLRRQPIETPVVASET